jgi:hypothetical protein
VAALGRDSASFGLRDSALGAVKERLSVTGKLAQGYDDHVKGHRNPAIMLAFHGSASMHLIGVAM